MATHLRQQNQSAQVTSKKSFFTFARPCGVAKAKIWQFVFCVQGTFVWQINSNVFHLAAIHFGIFVGCPFNSAVSVLGYSRWHTSFQTPWSKVWSSQCVKPLFDMGAPLRPSKNDFFKAITWPTFFAQLLRAALRACAKRPFFVYVFWFLFSSVFLFSGKYTGATARYQQPSRTTPFRGAILPTLKLT